MELVQIVARLSQLRLECSAVVEASIAGAFDEVGRKKLIDGGSLFGLDDEALAQELFELVGGSGPDFLCEGECLSVFLVSKTSRDHHVQNRGY